MKKRGQKSIKNVVFMTKKLDKLYKIVFVRKKQLRFALSINFQPHFFGLFNDKSQSCLTFVWDNSVEDGILHSTL